ncbi:MAG: hypothetical protein JOZ51_25630, partial [Chloroflexi bacterium]|nr:hypothetical protein [Chloroflexota bacterium]
MSRYMQARIFQVIAVLATIAALITGLQAQKLSARPLAQNQGQVDISCDFFSPTDIAYAISLEQGHGGPPTVTVVLTLVDGSEQ